MEIPVEERYWQLMYTVRQRFDIVAKLQALAQEQKNVFALEILGIQGRMILEAIAFGCLIAVENVLKKRLGQKYTDQWKKRWKRKWNAEEILDSLDKKGLLSLPSPSRIREPSSEEAASGANLVIEGIPEYRLEKDQLIKMYQYFHNWAHERNPYKLHPYGYIHGSIPPQEQERILNHLSSLERFLSKHMISLNGRAFFAVLWDDVDGQTKVISLDKISNS
ncbi:hypothetical protein [Thermus sp.]|uniref:hypothetical protein n=1 Tax=Thermus sp. TaxID=275 RepID=UPI00262D2E49|nr:hypothetical protein [Thermus sp.]MCX7850958.1 hypothetical protein [Thermus sp.]